MRYKEKHWDYATISDWWLGIIISIQKAGGKSGGEVFTCEVEVSHVSGKKIWVPWSPLLQEVIKSIS